MQTNVPKITIRWLKLGNSAESVMVVKRSWPSVPELSAHDGVVFVQDTAVTWLPDAVAAGARILTGVQVDCILTESQQQQEHGGSDAAQHARKLRATGVRASVTGSGVPTSGASRRSAVQIVITSRYVVSSAGSVHTPALLLRSGISARGNVGANLRVHPATFIYAAFPRVNIEEKLSDGSLRMKVD